MDFEIVFQTPAISQIASIGCGREVGGGGEPKAS